MFLCLSTDGDIDFILAPAVGSLTTASTGASQGPSTSTIAGQIAQYFHFRNMRITTRRQDLSQEKDVFLFFCDICVMAVETLIDLFYASV